MRALVAASVLLVAALVGGGLAGRTAPEPRPVLELAIDSVPQVTATLNITDWERVRAALGAPDLTGASPARDRSSALSRAYDTDLSAVSGLVVSEEAMTDTFGWSVFDLRWEAFAQSTEGAVTVAALDDRVSTGDVTAALQEMGFTPPEDGADDGGVWLGGADLLASLDIDLTPQLAFIAVLPEQGLVVTSDSSSYAARTVEVITGDGPSMALATAVPQTALALADLPVAVVHTAARGCEVTGFATASAQDRRAAAQLAEAAGGLVPSAGMGFGLDADGVLRVVQHFVSQAGAAEQRDVRLRLAAGPATGQGGDFDDRFRVAAAEVVGTDLVLDLRPVNGASQLLSDLASGPFLPAWCGSPPAVAG